MRAFVVTFLFMTSAVMVDGSEIREFDLKTRESLGQQLYRQDNIAARAEDLVAAQFPDKSSLSMKGWITEPGERGDTVYLLMEQDSGLVLAFSVHFPLVDPPEVSDRRGEPLPESVALRWKARRTAVAAATHKIYVGTVYNFEVLEDPTAPGFLVYALAATTNSKEMVVTGHYRISVNADGTKATRVDALSKGYIKQDRSGPAGQKAEAIVVTQQTSPIPVETFIYTSELYRLPVYVAAKDGSIWRVVNGSITKVDQAPVKSAAAAKKKATK
jgi:hypothetical protein